ncbi:MAG: hypothetical protein KJ556_20280 [Gammaproteobacteria bacterium]|nr:hypothetical protein [Gammaproteobacteria bacterium]
MSYANTVKDGSGTAYWLLCNSDGYLLIAGGAAHDAAAAGNPMRVAGVYRSSAPAVSDGDIADLYVDAAGRQLVVGAAANNAAATGNPVLISGIYESSDRTLDANDAGTLALDVAGRMKVVGAAAEDANAVGSPVLVGGRYDSSWRTLDNTDVGAIALDVAGRTVAVGASVEDSGVTGNPVLIAGRYDSTNRDLDNGDAGALALDADSRLYVNTGWLAALSADEAADDSDKTFTVTAAQEWQIQSIWVELTSSADAGNRQLCVELQDSASDVIGQWRAGAVQAASLTRYYMFSQAPLDLTAFRDTDYLCTPIAPLTLPPGYKIRVYDKAAIAAAADDMIIQLAYQYRVI